ncbi:hypothetical protein FM113_03015 [Leucobacter sp. 7(1)]|nr:hypothetical protein FM113_03015 [Leucobacter sp. 7(1)]
MRKRGEEQLPCGGAARLRWRWIGLGRWRGRRCHRHGLRRTPQKPERKSRGHGEEQAAAGGRIRRHVPSLHEPSWQQAEKRG